MKEKDIVHKLADEGLEAIGIGLKVEGKILKPVAQEVGRIVWWHASRNGLGPFLYLIDKYFRECGLIYNQPTVRIAH